MQTQERTIQAPSTLGQRLRAARKQRGLSQDEVAGTWFSKSYISAVERNKVNPSLKALRHIADRLQVPIHELLAGPIADGVDAETASPTEDVVLQIDRARWLIWQSQSGEALSLLDAAQDKHRERWAQLGAGNLYDFHSLRATAYLRARDFQAARGDIAEATRHAQQIREGGEEVEQARNLLGLTYFEQDSPHQALHQHSLGREAVQNGVVQSVKLKIDIYTNLANDYAALGDAEQTVSVLREMLDVAREGANLEAQAANLWSVSLSYQDRKDAEQAKQYRSGALTLLEAARNLEAVAQARIRLAKIATHSGEHQEAARLLDEAARILPHDSSKSVWSVLHEQQAQIELTGGRLEEAEQQAQKSLTLATEAYEDRAGLDEDARSEVVQAYARSLRTAALIAEAGGKHQAADELLVRALQSLSAGEHGETIADLEFDYAELLRARGEHEAAGAHYHLAYEHRQRRR